MRVIIEGYPYDAANVEEALWGLSPLRNIEQKVSVNYVGYYYNPQLKDCVFILPKVLMDEKDLVFSHLDPTSIINIDKAEGLTYEERSFIYEFAVWIYRAISVYNKNNEQNDIVYQRLVAQMGSGKQRKSNTFLDILLSLLRFNRENQDFFMTVLKNIHSGFNKINWNRTISHSSAVIQDNEPFYLNPVNKKKQINFDEELLVIYFSILNYIKDTYGFPVSINVGFQLIKGKQFEHYLKKFGKIRLKQIKYKYFSDKALRIWELCYAFFERAHQISIVTEQQEYLLVKNFNIVFEAIIDELIGDSRDKIPKGLKDQYDGKRVDHIYPYQSLTTNEDSQSIYYIGDSKYYKLGNNIGQESVYKQYTYAKNVIQWNLNLFINEDVDDKKLLYDKNHFGNIPKLRDDVTEGYNVIPNFFISARMDENLSFADNIYRTNRSQQSFNSQQFKNRLFDRDTLLVLHYDVNFLYVVSLYARQNEHQKSLWKGKVRSMFRSEIQEILQEQYDFYAMSAHPNVSAENYMKEHFQDVLGKVYTPYSDKNIFSLALDKKDPEGNNEQLLGELRRYFFVEECAIGENPSSVLEKTVFQSIEGRSSIVPTNEKNVLTGLVRKSDDDYNVFCIHQAKNYTMQKIPSVNLLDVKYFLPMVGGSIDGLYKIEKLSFGSYKDTESNAQPCLKLKLGEYVNFGNSWESIYRIKMQPGEVISVADTLKLYTQK
ncbi:hypothetical protein M2480_002911 [Parabacteroides sp. PFB2-12]|uniref:LlaJI family restriction endonuclease n=1 Tax=unclassified Parabacteroides TaxID=2649774 RepID=UPI002474063F|nr:MULTISPECIES: LlaJI family restriction endonuclease [unclassified Parabacteroides]MDH6343746.1 hypothetical protein [Parabacteroides sp. PM6-13]MDH6391908.1 hypothetical protein [Parabacteroides sp. PFB2-12]